MTDVKANQDNLIILGDKNKVNDGEDFVVKHIEEGGDEYMSKDVNELFPKDVIKVKFGTFVNLVANRDMADVIADNLNEEIILSSNLLTELAGAHDRREEKKIPLVFLIGIGIGVVLTYIFFST